MSEDYKEFTRDLDGLPIDPEGKKLFEMAGEIGDRRKQWYQMFRHYAVAAKVPALKENDVVVNIGCGNGQDSLPINSALTGKPFGFNGALTLIGIDIGSNVIDEAKKLNALGVKEYILGDARQLRNLLHWGKPKIIINRDSNIAEQPDIWADIYKEAFEELIDGGVLMATARQDVEYDLLKKNMQKAGFKIEINEENKFPGKKIEYAGSKGAYDKFIVIGRK